MLQSTFTGIVQTQSTMSRNTEVYNFTKYAIIYNFTC